MRQLLALLFVSSALHVAGAQASTPAVDRVDAPLPVFGGALVRFVHASPSFGTVRVEVASSVPQLDERYVVDLDYMEATEYREVPEGSYEIVIGPVGGDGDAFSVSERLDAVPGSVTTVALVGLALEEPADADAGEGFLAWLQGLFAPDRPELALRVLILDDLGGATYGPDAPAYRIVHAAPGTDAVDLAHVRDDAADVLATVSYLDASRFVAIAPDGGRLEVRAAGTTATIEAVSGIDHAPGLIHTVFLVGTPIEEIPLQTVVATATWAELGPVAPGTAGARGVTGLMTVQEVATLRELLVALGQRVDAAERRLQSPADVAESDGDVAEASRELGEAMRLLEQAHLVIDAAEFRRP